MNKKRLWITLSVLAAVASLAWLLVPGDKSAVSPEAELAPEGQLYTGKEETAILDIYFVDTVKGGFASEKATVYLSQSRVGRIKQALKFLLGEAKTQGLKSAYPEGSAVREVFLNDTGLCVVDFNTVLAQTHPGGTTAEYQTLYTLYRTLKQFSYIDKVQIMVGGKRVSSLAGHMDTMDPLTGENF